MWRVRQVLVLSVLFNFIGCGRENATRRHELLMFAIDYHSLSQANQGDVAWSDFDSLRKNYPNLSSRIDHDEVCVVWNAVLSADSEDVMAYEKSVPTAGGLVALCNAEVRQVTAADFKKLKLARTNTIPFQPAEKVELTGHNPDDNTTYVRVMNIRGLRMDLPEELAWSDTLLGYADANADFIVQAKSLPKKSLREAFRFAQDFMRSRQANAAKLSEVSHASLQGKLIEFDSTGLHQELLVLSDAATMKSVMIYVVSRSGSQASKRTRALLRTVDWQPEYLPDFKVDSAAQKELQRVIEASMNDGLRNACVVLEYPIMKLSIETKIPGEFTLMTFGKARIALSPATAFDVNRHELVLTTGIDGQEGFAVRRQP